MESPDIRSLLPAPSTPSEALFQDALGWLESTYHDHRFFNERDLVWTLQRWLLGRIDGDGLPYRLFHDYPVAPGIRRGLCGDLVFLDTAGHPELVVEFKFEPDHRRTDIWPTKFPVVFWGKDGVGKDVERVEQWVAEGRATCGYALFIDEGRCFRHRDPHPGSAWVDWETGPSLLMARFR